MSDKKQKNHERVLAYQAATVLSYDEMELVSGGNAGLHWTMHATFAAGKESGMAPKNAMDGNWDY